MTRTCGAFRRSFATKIYLTNVWSIELCTFVSIQSFTLTHTTTMATRYPTHTLFRFLIVSNSLDLILNILLKLWTAVVGKIVTFSYVLVSLSVMTLRFCASVWSQRNSIVACLRYPGSKDQSFLLDFCYFHCQAFLRSSRSFSQLAYPKVFRTH